MVELDQALEEWLKTVQEIGNLSLAEQSRITKAGAEVFKNELAKVTKENHYTNHNGPKYEHIADSLDVQKTGVDGTKNGKATVGWANNFHAQNARRLNDGTKKYRADHFVTKVQNDSAVQKKVLLAEKAEYDKIMQMKGAK